MTTRGKPLIDVLFPEEVPVGKKKRAPAPPPDRHAGRMIRVPDAYRAGLLELARRSGRPAAWELRALIAAAMRAAGLEPPAGAP